MIIITIYIYVIFFNSLYSSMVERNTVNILINVRFILRACTEILNVGLLYPYNVGSFKYSLLYALIILFQTFYYLFNYFSSNNRLCVCDNK